MLIFLKEGNEKTERELGLRTNRSYLVYDIVQVNTNDSMVNVKFLIANDQGSFHLLDSNLCRLSSFEKCDCGQPNAEKRLILKM